MRARLLERVTDMHTYEATENAMTKSLDHMVRRLLASHLGRPIQSVLPMHRLRRDLELLPFDLVLIAQELEEAAALRLPTRGLESVHTVAELTTLFEACARHNDVDASA